MGRRGRGRPAVCAVMGRTRGRLAVTYVVPSDGAVGLGGVVRAGLLGLVDGLLELVGHVLQGIERRKR